MKNKPPKEYSKIISECRKYIQCDTARISNPLGKMFFIIGYKKHTRENPNVICYNEKGEILEYEYIEEKVIASGNTKKELIDSVKKYVRLSKMTEEDYFKEQFLKKQSKN